MPNSPRMIGALAVVSILLSTACQSKRVREQLESVIPAWNESLLQVTDGPNWPAGLNSSKVLQATNDASLGARVQIERPTSLVSPSSSRVAEILVHVDTRRGEVRYASKLRAWTPERASTTRPLNDSTAREAVSRVLGALNVPANEIRPPRVASQVAAGAPAGAQQPTDTFTLYRLVTMGRQINQVPVLGSRVLATVNADTAIQRVTIVWPRFRLVPGLRLRPRREVIDEALLQILEQSPSGRLPMRARLAYVPRSSDDEVWFVPAVIVAVEDMPTPYEVVVPLASRIFVR